LVRLDSLGKVSLAVGQAQPVFIWGASVGGRDWIFPFLPSGPKTEKAKNILKMQQSLTK
jgi:hypothetical protein